MSAVRMNLSRSARGTGPPPDSGWGSAEEVRQDDEDDAQRLEGCSRLEGHQGEARRRGRHGENPPKLPVRQGGRVDTGEFGRQTHCGCERKDNETARSPEDSPPPVHVSVKGETTDEQKREADA